MIETLSGRARAALDRNPYLAAIRAGMVAVVPLTIVGGLFMIVAYLPVPGWDAIVAPYLPLLQIPVDRHVRRARASSPASRSPTSSARSFGQDAFASATMATVVFLMISLDPATQTFLPDGLGSRGLFTAILVAMVCVRVQKLFTDRDLVVRMPAGVPAIVRAVVPVAGAAVRADCGCSGRIRFALGVDINAARAERVQPAGRSR